MIEQARLLIQMGCILFTFLIYQQRNKIIVICNLVEIFLKWQKDLLKKRAKNQNYTI